MINLLCNRSVNKARASVHSVTRELQYIQVMVMMVPIVSMVIM